MAAHSVELVLDEESDAAVRAQWQALLAADLPSRARNPSPTNAPHLTLVAAADLSAGLDAALSEAVGGALPLEVRLGGLVLFGTGRPVLARLVVPTADLLAVQARVHAVVATQPDVARHCAPGKWTPHVTLARGIRPDRLGDALSALDAGTGRTPAAGGDRPVRLVAARRWDPVAEQTHAL